MKTIPIRHIRSDHEEQASSERFSIRKVQDLVGGQDLFQALHRHNFFFILALQNGKGTHEIDFTTYPVSDNSVFFIRPGQVHQLQLNAGSTGHLLEFNTGFYHPKDGSSTQRFRKAANKNFCLPDVDRIEKLHAILEDIFQEYTDKQADYQDIIKSNLEIFFIEFVRQSPNPKGPSTNANPYTQERFEEFSELLEMHLKNHRQVSHYTDLMNLSPYQLSEITRATIGKTPSAFINESIILEAKRYLLATPHQIQTIADHLGYEDVSYFIRFFRKHTGYSPDVFRQNFG